MSDVTKSQGSLALFTSGVDSRDSLRLDNLKLYGFCEEATAGLSLISEGM
jgi:hypothetical protein